MEKETVLVIFGGHNTEYYASCDSVGGMLDHLDRDLFDVLKIGVTEEGDWLLTEASSAEIGDGKTWLRRKDNRRAVITPVRGKRAVTAFDSRGRTEEIPIDCVFPLISGYGGEDGTLQGLLELADIPYVGSKVASSACAMDKQLTRIFARKCGVKQPRCLVLYRKDWEKQAESLPDMIGFNYPVFVKPASLGSSVGVSRVDRQEDLRQAAEEAFAYEDKILVEEGILGSEIKVALLGNEDLDMGAICQLTLSEGQVNDYAAKHIHFSSDKQIPADLPAELEHRIRKQAEDIYRALDCRGFARVDFFLDKKGELYFNEINTVPGIGERSIFALMFEKKGIPLKEVLTRLIRLAQTDRERSSARLLKAVH